MKHLSQILMNCPAFLSDSKSASRHASNKNGLLLERESANGCLGDRGLHIFYFSEIIFRFSVEAQAHLKNVSKVKRKMASQSVQYLPSHHFRVCLSHGIF